VVEQHYAAGMTVVWSGVTSVSKDPAVARQFAAEGGGPPGVVFRVRAFSGVAVENFSVFPEAEVRCDVVKRWSIT
jgi:hypothetical protein